MKQEDIAIVGISIFCPAGESAGAFWRGISEGGDFITDAPEEVIESFYYDGEPNGIDQFYCRRGGFSRPFSVDPLRFGILPILADGVDPDQLVSMAGTEQALIDAGVFEKNISLEKSSIIIGRGNFAGIIALRSLEIVRTSRELTAMLKIALPDLTEEDLEKVRKAYQSKKGRYQADMAIGTMPNLTASLVANRFDMHGPAYLVDAACASGILAIDHSIALLRRGDCDIAVAGGLHTGHSAMFWGAFEMLGAVSHRQVIAPFSKHADGLLIGQGGGFIVLKTLKKAREDGDRIYAVIKETAVSSDGGGSHVTVTNVKGQLDVLKKAWGKADMDPRHLGYLEAHGTATPVGDKTEITTLRTFFGDDSYPRAYVGSVKSNIGHTMPAAGMIGVIKTALSLYHRTIAPTLHCEEPLADMFESRFRPPQEAIPWDPEKYPLVAGVNAFGFGGINAHAILAAADQEPEPLGPWAVAMRQPKEAIAISARDPVALIQKLEFCDYMDSGGDCRLVILNPDEKRIRTAIDIIKKGKPWTGKLNIWYTPAPLLSGGGKMVFLFPGFTAETDFELDSLSAWLEEPPFAGLVSDWKPENENALNTLKIYYLRRYAIQALAKLGIQADMYAGHSVGEWDAAVCAGILKEKDTDGDPTRWRRFAAEDAEAFPYIAVSAGPEEAKAWCEEIPGLYLANDNCQDQMVFCGREAAAKTFREKLEEEGIFHAVLPFGWGTHTPLADLEPCRAFIDKFHVGAGDVPVWSSATLEQTPTERAEYLELVRLQMSTTVRFRELVEKLYREENARVFIQIGPGNLTGFIENILKGKDFSVVSTAKTNRTGVDQIRSVLANLFVMGQKVDMEFLGVNPAYQTERTLKVLPRGAPPILSAFPELEEVIHQRYGAMGPGAGLSDSLRHVESPFLQMAAQNLKEAVQTQNEMLSHFHVLPRSRVASVSPTSGQRMAASAPSPSPSPGSGSGTGSGRTRLTLAAQPQPALDFEETLHLTLDDHPYLLDHAIIRQPKDWFCNEDLNPVVPLAMTIELLAAAALKHAPGRKIIRFQKIGAFKWIEVKTPFRETLTGHWKDGDLLQLQLGNYASAEIVFGDAWPDCPPELKESPNIGEEIMPPVEASFLYDRYSFHGPMYHVSSGKTKVHAKGMIAPAEKNTGRGSLLDTLGQQIGFFLHLTQTENTICFPVQLKELTFYGDLFDQDGSFEHTLTITKLTENNITGAMMLKRDGKIWCSARGYLCQRFTNITPVWNVILSPYKYILAKETVPGQFRYGCETTTHTVAMLSKRYLNQWDREKLGLSSLGEMTDLTRAQDYLIPAIVLKDAVRCRLADGGEMIYPIEIFCEEDEDGIFHPWRIDADGKKLLPFRLRLDRAEDGNAIVSITDTDGGG